MSAYQQKLMLQQLIVKENLEQAHDLRDCHRDDCHRDDLRHDDLHQHESHYDDFQSTTSTTTSWLAVWDWMTNTDCGTKVEIYDQGHRLDE